MNVCLLVEKKLYNTNLLKHAHLHLVQCIISYYNNMMLYLLLTPGVYYSVFT